MCVCVCVLCCAVCVEPNPWVIAFIATSWSLSQLVGPYRNYQISSRQNWSLSQLPFLLFALENSKSSFSSKLQKDMICLHEYQKCQKFQSCDRNQLWPRCQKYVLLLHKHKLFILNHSFVFRNTYLWVQKQYLCMQSHVLQPNNPFHNQMVTRAPRERHESATTAP